MPRDGVEQECPGILCSPAWDCAIPGILGAKQPPPSADKLLEQTGKLRHVFTCILSTRIAAQ